jgi:hypothetical protein
VSAPGFTLSNAYPNPSHGTPIQWDAQVSGTWTVDLSVFTSRNRKIRQEIFTVNGNTTLTWDLRDKQGGLVANGIYFVRFKAVNGSQIVTRIFKVIVSL